MATPKRFSSILFLLFTKSLVAKIVSKQFPTEFYRKSNSANFLPKNSFSRHFWCVFETALNRHFWNLIVLNRRYCVISEWWKVIWSDVEWFEVNGRWKLKIRLLVFRISRFWYTLISLKVRIYVSYQVTVVDGYR